MNSMLRMRLRDVNIELSAVVRDVKAADRTDRLAQLRRRRAMLMEMLVSNGPPLVSGHADMTAMSVGIEFLLPAEGLAT